MYVSIRIPPECLSSAGLLQAYSNGLSEVILGKAIKQFNLPRDAIVIMTKVCEVVWHQFKLFRQACLAGLCPSHAQSRRPVATWYGPRRDGIC